MNPTSCPHVRTPALPAAVITCALGPLALIAIMALVARSGTWLHPSLLLPAGLGALLALFGPHPASLVSAWTQDTRDRVLVGRAWPVRAVGMLPGLLAHPATRAVTLAQAAGLIGGIALLVRVAV